MAAFLTACATSPHQAVQALDPSAEKYGTQECAQARQIALTYDDNVGGRIGLGLGLGLLLGPFGLPFAFAADASQATKRNAVLAQLKSHCEGNLTPEQRQARSSPDSAPKKSDAVVRLELLQELRTKGLLTEEEFEKKRKQLVENL
jgi:hypothetical protein